MPDSDTMGIPFQHDGASSSRTPRLDLAGLENIRSLGLELSDILDVPAVQALIDEFHQLVPIPFAIIDLAGKVLVGAGWQDICLKYHRINPETCKHCIESDTELSAGVPDGEMKLYKCKNHMWDIVTPIMVGGEHIGNIFSGQFFFDDELIDRELFREQARRYGFPEQEYLAALDTVPHVSRSLLEQSMRFFVRLAQMISQMSYTNIRLRQSLKERDTLMASRQEKEEALRQSENKFALLFSKASLPAVLTRLPDHSYVDVNEAWTQLFGYSRAEMIGQTSLEIGASRDPAQRAHFLSELSQRRPVRDFEQTVYTKSGDARIVLSNANVVTIGGDDYAISTVQDITVRKRMEARLRRFYETDLFAILYWKIDGGVVSVNDKFLEMTGYTRDDLNAGRLNWAAMTPPEYHARDEQARQEVRETGVHLPYEKEFIRKDGTRVWGLFSATAWPDTRDEGVSFILDITERKRAEAKLAEAKLQAEVNAAQLRAILDSMTERLYVCDRDGNMLLMNEEARGLYEGGGAGMPRSVAEMQEHVQPYYLDGRVVPTAEWPIVRSLRGERVRGTELRIHSKTTGQDFIFSYNGAPVRDQNGDIVMAVFTADDITSRKQHEAELQKLNRTLSALGHSNQSLLHADDEAALLERVCQIIVKDCGYKLVWIGLAEADERKSVRPVARAGFEEGYLETVAITWADDERGRGPTGTAIRTGRPTACRNILTDPAFEPWRKDALARGYASSIVLPLTIPVDHPAAASVVGPELECGKVFGAITIYSPLPDPFSESEVKLLLELAADLSYGIRMIRARAAHEKAEQELRENRAKLDAALASMTDAVFISDTEGRFHHFNDAFATFHRFKNKSDCAQTLAEYSRILEVNLPDGTPVPLDMWAVPRALRGESASNAEYSLRRKDTGESWMGSYSFGPIRDKDGDIVGSVVVGRDITDRKRAEQALLRSEKLASVGQMAASISHEINNPLAAVGTYLYLAQESGELPESAREFIESAQAELQRVEYITHQSLGFFRECNAPTTTSITQVLESTLDLLKSRIREKSAVIDKQWHEDVIINAVSGELRQVFANLVSNSLDAVDRNGRIALRVSRVSAPCQSRACVRISVADDGKGISASSLTHVFEPFFTTKGTMGTGLGLWVSKQLIEKHHGTIRVRSSCSDRRHGTVFSIVLPIDGPGEPVPSTSV